MARQMLGVPGKGRGRSGPAAQDASPAVEQAAMRQMPGSLDKGASKNTTKVKRRKRAPKVLWVVLNDRGGKLGGFNKKSDAEHWISRLTTAARGVVIEPAGLYTAKYIRA